MKKLPLILALFCAVLSLRAQDPQAIYLQGVDEAQAGNFTKAIVLFTQTIELQPENYYAWYNRGIAQSMLGLYEEALPDFNQTVKLAPEFKKGYLNRGTARKRLTDYEGALADYNQALTLDPKYSDAYYNRGLVYEMLGKRDSACTDFNQANNLGSKSAPKKVERCNDKNLSKIKIYPILRLTETTDDNQYGFSEDNPVKVGAGPEGGPANQRAYLNLLRDKQGKPLRYERLNSCCAYATPNAPLGSGMLDRYEITYQDENKLEKKAVVYISFYDYETPKILFGFKTIGK